MVTEVVMGKNCKWWDFSLHNFLYPHITTYLSAPDIVLRTLFTSPSTNDLP